MLSQHVTVPQFMLHHLLRQFAYAKDNDRYILRTVWFTIPRKGVVHMIAMTDHRLIVVECSNPHLGDFVTDKFIGIRVQEFLVKLLAVHYQHRISEVCTVDFAASAIHTARTSVPFDVMDMPDDIAKATTTNLARIFTKCSDSTMSLCHVPPKDLLTFDFSDSVMPKRFPLMFPAKLGPAVDVDGFVIRYTDPVNALHKYYVYGAVMAMLPLSTMCKNRMTTIDPHALYPFK